ncbi:MAG TPA: hypothetical protein VFL86_10735 [Burkholderiaceae bacterium]|nr:hypothetical protein [Burkholderiaceae bacterium]
MERMDWVVGHVEVSKQQGCRSLVRIDAGCAISVCEFRAAPDHSVPGDSRHASRQGPLTSPP